MKADSFRKTLEQKDKFDGHERWFLKSTDCKDDERKSDKASHRSDKTIWKKKEPKLVNGTNDVAYYRGEL